MKEIHNFSLKSIAAAAFTLAAILLLSQCEVPPTGGGGDNDSTAHYQPDTAWYTDNPDAAAFEISTADELAGLALLVTKEESPVDFAGKTVRLTADIDLPEHYGKSYNDKFGWIPIGNKDRPFRGTFDGGGKAVKGLYIKGTNFYHIAGFFGRIDNGAVVKNVGLKDINITGGNCLGGIVGSATGGGKVINCHAIGVVNGNQAVGGVAGDIVDGEIKDCYFVGTVKAKRDVGGVVGNIDNVNVANCYALGDMVSGELQIGGVVGSADATSSTTVTNCYSTVGVSSSSISAGGIVGFIWNNVKVTDCAALNKSVYVKETEDRYFGRVVGYRPDNSTLSGNIAFSGMEGGAAWDSIGASNIDGADITKDAVNSDGTLGGRFKTTDGWTTANGKLPGLGGSAVDMPEHLK